MYLAVLAPKLHRIEMSRYDRHARRIADQYHVVGQFFRTQMNVVYASVRVYYQFRFLYLHSEYVFVCPISKTARNRPAILIWF